MRVVYTLWVLIGLTISAVVLWGCASQPAASDVTMRLVCSSELAAPITYSDKDTPETIAQINRHNGSYTCVCAKDCPP
jgi:hypothetical protein